MNNKIKTKKERAFTLSEVIITLVVLGIVAAITVPMLSNSASDKKWNVARQKAHATIGEAFRLMTVNGEIDTKLSTQQFVEKVIPKYLKLAKTCSNASACGFASSYKKAVGSGSNALPITWQTSTDPGIATSSPTAVDTWGTLGTYNHTNPNTNNSYFFKTLDGFSVNFFYNPYCATSTKDKYRKHTTIMDNKSGYDIYDQTSMDTICMMGVYDMNGKKGPNQVGKDMGFVGSLYNGFETRVVSVLPYNADKKVGTLPHSGYKWMTAALNYCKNLDKDGTWILASLDEMNLLYLNMKLVWGWTSTNQQRWYVTRTNYGTYGVAGGKTYYGDFGIADQRYGNRGNASWEGNSNLQPDFPNYVMCVRANALK